MPEINQIMGGDGEADSSDSECVVHDHPVPAEEMHRYSMVRDPAAENDIRDYVHSQARDETVQHVERVKSEYVAGTEYEIWDVTTDKNRWWVLTNGTNLYSQKHFPSLDYTLSFHIGLMTRVMSRSRGADADEPQPFDEVFRRLQQAEERHERAVEIEEFQAVGMQLREALLSLSAVLQRRVEFPEDVDRPQVAAYKPWSDLILNQILPGREHQALRSYLKAHSDKTWDLVSALTHDRRADSVLTQIALNAVVTLVSDHVRLLMHNRPQRIEECPNCTSRRVRTHFDILIEPDGAYFETCAACDWSSHPGHPDEAGA